MKTTVIRAKQYLRQRSRHKPRGPTVTRGRRVGHENEGDRMGGGRGGALRLYVPPSYATLRAALGIETDLVANQ